MNVKSFRKFNLLVFCALILINCTALCFGQEKPNHVTFNEVLNRLTFSSRVNKTDAEINQKLIEQIRERKVDFLLTKENEAQILKAKGSRILLKAINENIVEDVKKKRILEQSINKELTEAEKKKETIINEMRPVYQRFVDNYAGKTYEQRKIALATAKEFLERFSKNIDVDNTKEIIDYLKAYVESQVQGCW